MAADYSPPADGINFDVRPRADLAVVELDGDLVVYDPAAPACHVLSGGAVVVWAELNDRGPGSVVEGVCQRVSGVPHEIGDQITGVIADLARLNLLEPAFDGRTKQASTGV